MAEGVESGVAEGVAAVVDLEVALLTPEVRRSRERLEELLDPEFTEIGASGRSWSRAETVAALTEDESVRGPVRIIEVAARVVAPDLVLLTYLSDPAGRAARRSSLWRRSRSGWRLLHHQGTLLPGPVSPAG